MGKDVPLKSGSTAESDVDRGMRGVSAVSNALAELTARSGTRVTRGKSYLGACPVVAFGVITRLYTIYLFKEKKMKWKGIIPPRGGWKKSTLYLVSVAYSGDGSIPPTKGIYYTGLLPKKIPYGEFRLNMIWHPGDEEVTDITQVTYMKVIRELDFSCD